MMKVYAVVIAIFCMVCTAVCETTSPGTTKNSTGGSTSDTQTTTASNVSTATTRTKTSDTSSSTDVSHLTSTVSTNVTATSTHNASVSVTTTASTTTAGPVTCKEGNCTGNINCTSNLKTCVLAGYEQCFQTIATNSTTTTYTVGCKSDENCNNNAHRTAGTGDNKYEEVTRCCKSEMCNKNEIPDSESAASQLKLLNTAACAIVFATLYLL